ncbi:Thioredoxin-like protein 4B,Thioredoxin-like protein 4A [Acanthosepion pharaonis]|uniref:Thioredoxin-like protein n=1 Tax=Acanthosepion pharaonis TaxID=158019 RepID=A0A812C302_ACAPH|nr:Thioredoxin-like protein 4B,Thioredoxin-like protein 4A [Sepia pharaonis]
MAGILLPALSTKEEVDRAILSTRDKVLLLRFGCSSDLECMKLDDILAKLTEELSNMAVIYTVDVYAVPVYTQYFDISLIPSTIFFFNAQHIKVDWGTPDHTKFVGSFKTKQNVVDVVEVIYRGAMKGKLIVKSPLDHTDVPYYELIYKDI